jgi:hypothetical protein
LAGVAQLVEQRIRNAKVGSSTLLTGTSFFVEGPLRAGPFVFGPLAGLASDWAFGGCGLPQG